MANQLGLWYAVVNRNGNIVAVFGAALAVAAKEAADAWNTRAIGTNDAFRVEEVRGAKPACGQTLRLTDEG